MDGDTSQSLVIKSEPTEPEPCNENSGCNEEPAENNNVNSEKIIYELGADATITFTNGSVIKVNKTMLSFYSPVFAEMFFGLSRGNNVTIHEYNPETFKAFLDCLFGFQSYTPEDALLFYPIAHKLKVQKSLSDCIAKLTPSSSSEMNENICFALNLALKYKCVELTDSVLSFFKNSFGILNLFEREDYLFLLEPASVFKIIENVKMNSFLTTILYKWGVNYLNENNSDQSVLSFFKEHQILPKISFSNFETLQSIFDFHNLSKKNLFSCSDVLDFINFHLKNLKNFPVKGEWIKVKQGDVIEETIIFKQPLMIDSVINLKLKVRRNSIFYDFIEGKDKEEDEALDLNISYNFKKQFCRRHCRHNKDLCSSELSQFGTKKGTLKNNYIRRIAIIPLESSDICNIRSIKVEYKFKINCRILKSTEISSLAADDDDNKLYFTCGVQIL